VYFLEVDMVGAWKRIIKKEKVNISFNYYRLLSSEESHAVKEAAPNLTVSF
jgi:hypothetical protein